MGLADSFSLPTPKEDEEQAALFQWAAYNAAAHPELLLLMHIPNEGKRTVQNGAKMKRIGLKAGVPDILLPVSHGGFHALYIEMKRTKDGKVSDNQKWWIEKLNQNGNLAVVCFGWVAAKDVICRYLDIKEKTI